jgi:transposase-like protein
MNVLGLPTGFAVEGAAPGEGAIAVKSIEVDRTCPWCGRTARVHAYGRTKLIDVPNGKEPSVLSWRRARLHCPGCDRTFVEPSSEVDDRHRMTRRLLDWLQSESQSQSLNSLSKRIGVSEGTLRSVASSLQWTIPARELPSNRMALVALKAGATSRPAVLDLDRAEIVSIHRSIDELALAFLPEFAPTLPHCHLLVVSCNPEYLQLATMFGAREIVADPASMVLRVLQLTDGEFRRLCSGTAEPRANLIAAHKRAPYVSQATATRIARWKTVAPELWSAYSHREALLELFGMGLTAPARRRLLTNWMEKKSELSIESQSVFSQLARELEANSDKLLGFYDRDDARELRAAIDDATASIPPGHTSFDVLQLRLFSPAQTQER